MKPRSRVFVIGGPATGKTMLARHLVTATAPEPVLLVAGAVRSVEDVLSAVEAALLSLPDRPVIVDGYDGLIGWEDARLLDRLLGVTARSRLLITASRPLPALSGLFTLVSFGPWHRDLVAAAIWERAGRLRLTESPAALAELLRRFEVDSPLAALGAMDSLAAGGLAAAESWLRTEAARAEPELTLVRNSDGRIAVTRVVRMPETHFPDALTAVPLVTLGRRGRAWAKEISELEVLINDPSVREHDLQAFFEANPQFLSGVDYDRVVPHPVLTRDEGGPLIPDFMLEVTGGAADVLDLKLPTARLVTGSRDRRRFGRVVQDALAQVREYGAYFDLPANRQRVAERYGLQAYRPQLTVVIGRSSTSDDPLHLRRLWSEIPPRSRIMTYDELLERVKRLERMRWF
ncbi:hypothetical protein GCM10009534_18100 [Kribbella sandramycini]